MEENEIVVEFTDDVDPHVALARYTVESYVSTGIEPELPDNVPEELLGSRAGVFVSLHIDGKLRGCIGTIGPSTPSVAEEILRNGIHACAYDPRFGAVHPWELDSIEYSVDVLGAPERVESLDELDPKRYGVIVSQGLDRGVLLPDLPGVDTPELQVGIAKQKAYIPVSDPDVMIERFEVVRHTLGGQPRLG